MVRHLIEELGEDDGRDVALRVKSAGDRAGELVTLSATV
jgi:hypothetical protein